MTREDAIAISQSAAKAEGWAPLEPIEAELMKDERSGRNVWSIISWPVPSVNSSRGYVQIVVDDETGEVMHKSYNPR